MALQLEQTTKQLRLSESKATWREVARTIAHEIKNPLTPIKLSTQRVQKKFREKAEDFPKALETATQTILHEIENMERLVEAFHNYAKLPDPIKKEENINSLLLETVDLYASTTNGIHTALEEKLPSLVFTTDSKSIVIS